MFTWMCGVKRKDRIRNECMKVDLQESSIEQERTEKTEKCHWRRFEHVHRKPGVGYNTKCGSPYKFKEQGERGDL